MSVKIANLFSHAAGKEFTGTAGFYGHASIIKAYSGYPMPWPLPVAVQHGWYQCPTAEDATFRGQLLFWSPRIADLHYKIYGKRNGRVVGCPFLYLLRLLGNEITPITRSGSIVFPAHSSELTTVDFSYERYAEALDSLPSCYKPIAVCMYYTDLRSRRHEIFEKRGFEIVNNGTNRNSVDFLLRFIENASGRKYALSNEMSSALLYARALGLIGFLWGPEVTYKHTSRSRALTGKRCDIAGKKCKEAWKEAFRFPEPCLALQDRFVKTELGEAYLLSPLEMRRLLIRESFGLPYIKELLKRGIARMSAL